MSIVQQIEKNIATPHSQSKMNFSLSHLELKT